MKHLLNLVIVGLVTRAAFVWMQDQTTPHSSGEHSNPEQDTLTPDEVRWIHEMGSVQND